MEAKHTPGPWEFGINPRGGYSNGVVVRPAGEFPHGLWIADCGCEYDEERQANARLISAAPELLELIERAHEADCPDEDIRTAWWEARAAAIAKATGSPA